MVKSKCFESERCVVESPWLKSGPKSMYSALRSMRVKGEWSKKTAALRAGQPANIAAKSMKELEEIGLIKNGAGKDGKDGVEFTLISGKDEEITELLAKLKEEKSE